MKNWPAKSKLIAIIISGFAATSVVYFFVFMPLVAELNSLHDQTQEQKRVLNKLLVEEVGYRTSRSDFSRIKSRADEIEQIFPAREQLVGHVEKLEAVAKAMGEDFSISITDAKENPQASQPNEQAPEYSVVTGLQQVEVIPYEFHLNGSFAEIVGFLQAMENQPFFSEVERIALNSQRREMSGGGVTGKFVRSGRVEATMRAAFYAEESKQKN